MAGGSNQQIVTLPELTSFALWQICAANLKPRYYYFQSKFQQLTSLATFQVAPSDSPTLKDFAILAGAQPLKIVKHVPTRWLSLCRVIKHTLDM